MKIPVFLKKVSDYEVELKDVLYDVLEYFPINGKKILIKPNLIGKKNFEISCTNPYVVYHVCNFFIKKGFKVLVGDSPAFGSVKSMCQVIGLDNLLKGNKVQLIEFHKYKSLKFPYPLAQEIFQVDCVINICKLKAHGQMGFSLSTKNLFGLIVGYSKLLAHIKFGDSHESFSKLILKILKFVPNTINILDGIEAMEGTGPLDGNKKICNLIGISKNPIALDTAIYHILGVNIHEAPLWRQAQDQGILGAQFEHLDLIKDSLDPVLISFSYPKNLRDISFRPDKILLSFIKRFFLKNI